jgi:hypothetical protein
VVRSWGEYSASLWERAISAGSESR